MSRNVGAAYALVTQPVVDNIIGLLVLDQVARMRTNSQIGIIHATSFHQFADMIAYSILVSFLSRMPQDGNHSPVTVRVDRYSIRETNNCPTRKAEIRMFEAYLPWGAIVQNATCIAPAVLTQKCVLVIGQLQSVP